MIDHIDETDDEHHALHEEALRETGFWGRQAAGCLVLARSTGRFLVPHRSFAVLEPDTWGTWGGAVDPDEDPRRAVVREVQEETGYEGDVLDIVDAYVFQSGSFRYSNFIVVVEDEFEPVLNWESQGSRWCTYGDWPDEEERHFGLTALLDDPASALTMRRLSESVRRPSSAVGR